MPAFLIWKYERRNTYAELCELFCGIYEWSHSFAAAAGGCIGLCDRTGESDEASSGRNADLRIGMYRSGGFRCRQYLPWDSPGRRKDRYGTYSRRRGQRYRFPGGGNHHYYREKSGQRIDNGCRIVERQPLELCWDPECWRSV